MGETGEVMCEMMSCDFVVCVLYFVNGYIYGLWNNVIYPIPIRSLEITGTLNKNKMTWERDYFLWTKRAKQNQQLYNRSYLMSVE